MAFKPLKKIILASALTLAAAFNAQARSQEVPAAPATFAATPLSGDSVHRFYDQNGVLVSIERYRNGQLNDGPNGEPANLVFYKDGKVFFEGHCKDGKLNDGANGEPAYQVFDPAGKLAEAVRYSAGEAVKVLSKEEIDAYQKEKAAALKAKERAEKKEASRRYRLLKRGHSCY